MAKEKKLTKVKKFSTCGEALKYNDKLLAIKNLTGRLNTYSTDGKQSTWSLTWKEKNETV